MEDICVLDYSQDLEYWGVDTIWLETCCESKYSARKQFIKDTSRKEKAYQDACKVRYQVFGAECCERTLY